MDYVLEIFRNKEVRINLNSNIDLFGVLKFDCKAPFIEIESLYEKRRVYFNPAQVVTINEVKG